MNPCTSVPKTEVHRSQAPWVTDRPVFRPGLRQQLQFSSVLESDTDQLIVRASPVLPAIVAAAPTIQRARFSEGQVRRVQYCSDLLDPDLLRSHSPGVPGMSTRICVRGVNIALARVAEMRRSQ
jgi:hypothetical protein